MRLLLILTLLNGWHTQQLDFVQAFTQAPVERDIYMQIPKGFEADLPDPEEYCLQLHKNLFGQKQAGRVWNKYLVKKLASIGFKQSSVDECVFYRGTVLYILYTNDSILAGPVKSDINAAVQVMKDAGLTVTDEGMLDNFLGVNIDRQNNGTIKLSQPKLIDQILSDL